jgi:rSAM/selenodomain-associated transferase 1
MARWPAPGRCKRRLAAGLGDRRAASIQARLGDHVLAAAGQARCSAGRGAFELVLAVDGLGRTAADRWSRQLGADRAVPQGSGSLGLRLQRQVERALREGARSVLLIGSDLPLLHAGDLLAALEVLERGPLVLGPAADGGYWLIGLGCRRPALFCGIDWGSERVLQQTLAAAHGCGLTPELLAVRPDLDRPADLLRWR